MGRCQVPSSEHSHDSVQAHLAKLSPWYIAKESCLPPINSLAPCLQQVVELTVSIQLDLKLVQQFVLSWVPGVIMLEC